MAIFDRGTAIKAEVEFFEAVPFRDDARFDPSSPTITVTDPASTEKVAAQAMTKAAKGKYYYIIQTASGWATGDYIVKIEGGDGTYSAVKQRLKAFELR